MTQEANGILPFRTSNSTQAGFPNFSNSHNNGDGNGNNPNGFVLGNNHAFGQNMPNMQNMQGMGMGMFPMGTPFGFGYGGKGGRRESRRESKA